MASGMTDPGKGLSLRQAGIPPFRHIEFIRFDPKRALVRSRRAGNDQWKTGDGTAGCVTAGQLTEAANFLNAHLAGRTMRVRSELIGITAKVRFRTGMLSQIWSTRSCRSGPAAG